jgi:DDE superfamily endonuclease
MVGNLDCPGRWHDSLIMDRSADFIAALPEGLWILGDSAFPRIKGRVARARKKNELLPYNQEEDFCGKIRIASEWGIKDLKNTWRRMKLPLPSDNVVFRRARWDGPCQCNSTTIEEEK